MDDPVRLYNVNTCKLYEKYTVDKSLLLEDDDVTFCNYSSRYEVFRVVKDWRLFDEAYAQKNIHVGFNPRNINYEWEDFDVNMKWMFSIPWLEQKTEPWLREKMDHISGSELGAAFDIAEVLVKHKYLKKPYENMNSQALFESKCNLRPPLTMNAAMGHGSDFEDLAGLRYSCEEKELTFKFGFIPHRTYNFIGVSPDLVTHRSTKAVEIKSPYYREIIDADTFENLLFQSGCHISYTPHELQLLCNEVITTGDPCKYLAITNLPIEVSKLTTKLVYYYHQCQLQSEVIGMSTDIDFVQLGIPPNEHYVENDQILTITNVPFDPTWMSTHIETLTRLWERVLTYRGKNPDWLKKKWDTKMDADLYEDTLLETRIKAINNVGIKRVCPFETSSTAGNKQNAKIHKPLTFTSNTPTFSNRKCPF